MPVVLPSAAWSTWLGEEQAEPDQLKSMLVPYAGEMVAWPVSQRVGNVKNNDAGLVEPISV
jgi:putative SOS response-associated peptidase YedK